MEVYYPIHVTKVLAIQATGTALSNGQTNYGFGLVASNANSAGFTLLNCSEEAPRYYKEASWIVIGIYRVDMSIIVVQIEELGISQSHSLMPAYPQ